MGSKHYATPSQILQQLDGDYFTPFANEILGALETLHRGRPFADQIEAAGKCLGVFWANYSRRNIAKIFQAFPRVQRALFGLEEDPAQGMRYRDHYVHMLDVFITGSRIISEAISQVPGGQRETFILNLFKTVEEPADLPFPHPYNAKERLFFLWTLVATFHDIGIPVEHLDKLRSGLNKFLKYFGLSLSEFQLVHRTHVTAQLRYYFECISKLYTHGIQPNADKLYDAPARGNQYLWHALANAYGESNHGVVSAVCLFNSYEETFLIGHHEDAEYDLTNEQYSDFVVRVLEHDLSRAALSIALHSMSPSVFPKLFPIDSSKYPLTFLLVLCDELQEPFRLEGITFPGIAKLTRFPDLRVKVSPDLSKVSIRIGICYVTLEPEDEKHVLEAATSWGKDKDIHVPTKYPELLAWTWGRISETLKEKLLLTTSPFAVRVCVYLEQPGQTRILICEEKLTP